MRSGRFRASSGTHWAWDGLNMAPRSGRASRGVGDEPARADERRDADRRARPPYYNEWRGASDEHPDPSTAVERFGSWRAALAAAGLR
jgi:hypothetical protein